MSESVKRNYSPVMSQHATTDVILDEEDVTDYMAGYLLHRPDKHSAVVSHVRDDKGGRFMTLLDRGGLTKPSVEFVFPSDKWWCS